MNEHMPGPLKIKENQMPNNKQITEKITIGKYELSFFNEMFNFTDKKTIWIETDDGGEGGQFSTKDFEAVIERFYNERF